MARRARGGSWRCRGSAWDRLRGGSPPAPLARRVPPPMRRGDRTRVACRLTNRRFRRSGEDARQGRGGVLPEGVRRYRRSGIRTPPWESAGAPLLESTPLLVASSSRPPADASGGQEKWDLSLLAYRGLRRSTGGRGAPATGRGPSQPPTVGTPRRWLALRPCGRRLPRSRPQRDRRR